MQPAFPCLFTIYPFRLFTISPTISSNKNRPSNTYSIDYDAVCMLYNISYFYTDLKKLLRKNYTDEAFD